MTHYADWRQKPYEKFWANGGVRVRLLVIRDVNLVCPFCARYRQ